TQRTLLRLDCRRRDEYIEITVEADSFLYQMVRNIAAALIQVGRGALPAEALADALKKRQRLPKCPPAPACGLCLVQVSYSPGGLSGAIEARAASNARIEDGCLP
ncbi:MAG: tRNA pseudouridine(38-40) synthase TruA, partial [Armatimonadetes bacterium]|nr:tRNA pseudouridine(38-40) synthase TruA [Armatimonadota bacterium]